jgi:hypothetical protein
MREQPGDWRLTAGQSVYACNGLLASCESMRLVSYVTDRSARCGIQLGNTLYDASAVAQAAGLSFEDQSTDWSKTKEVIGRGDKIGWKTV